MTADVKEVFTGSELSKDPRRLNVFVFVLDHEGRLVHGFHGLPGRGENRSDYKAEITKALGKLKLPAGKAATEERPVALPDLKGTAAGRPAGVRLFVRPNNEKDPSRSKRSVVEVVPVTAEQWQALSFPDKSREVESEALKSWLVQMYPPAIRTVDQSKPFTKMSGSLKLEPAGADRQRRYALLRGEVRLAKGDDTQSAFEGTLQAVLTYRRDSPEVRSLRAVVEGDYVYRIRGTQRIPLMAAIESRPE
jgi:hypothetical protein